MTHLVGLLTLICMFFGVAMDERSDRRYFNLNGISFELYGDVEQARRIVPAAQRLMFKTKLTNTQGLRQLRNEAMLGNGIEIRVSSVFGDDRAKIYYPPGPPVGVKPKERIITRKRMYPVLGISLSPHEYLGERVGDMYQEGPVPLSTITSYYMGLEQDRLWYESILSDKSTEWKKYNRLVDVSLYGNQYSTSPSEYSYTPVEDHIIWDHEFAYRTIWDPFGHSYNVDPVIFTCGDYVPETELEIELYHDEIRAAEFERRYDYSLVVAVGAGRSSTSSSHYVYDREFMEDYNIPDDLVADGWPEAMRNRCCYADGDYEVWERRGSTATHSGISIYWEEGCETNGEASFDENEHSACLYSRYNLSGARNYSYQLILYVDGEDYLVYSGTRTDDSEMPDDIYVVSVKIFDFYGLPVVVFGYVQFFVSQPDIAKYGIWFNGELRLTEDWPIDAYITHPVNVPDEYSHLYGYGEPVAFGIEVEETTIVDSV